VPYFSRRLTHVLTHADLAALLAPTYAEAVDVDLDEALERMTRALASPGIADDLYQCVSAALSAAQGSRSENELMDKLGRSVPKRRGRIKAATSTMALTAVMVRINIELGLAPEQLRATLEGEKGQALLRDGLAALGEHLVRDLLR
jgi:hypothetical protein